MLKEKDISTLKDLRHFLHQHPELSGQEVNTASAIVKFINQQQPHQLIQQLGGYGVLANWKGKKTGPNLLFRAELDALPISEKNDIPYASQNSGISHKCGHDGHMTILFGWALLLNRIGLESGSVSLLFQPAELNGQGAKAILEDSRFKELSFDHAFALHNIPKVELGHILSKEQTFCMASRDIQILFEGKTAHASQPKTGLNPTQAIVQLTHFLNHSLDGFDFTSDTLATITHIQIGEPTFGISPGQGEIRVTIRAEKNHDLELLEKLIIEESEKLASSDKLALSVAIHDSFSATTNSASEVAAIQLSCENCGLPYKQMRVANQWSEDFGLFLERIDSAMFGIEAGKHCPDLHDPDYDFPDELIEIGSNFFWQLSHDILKKATS